MAITSVMLSSSPSRRRVCRWPTGSASARARDEHVAVAHVDVEAAGVVGPQVERAARHEVEAGVVPVARDEPGLDRALVQREAEVRAAVLDRERRAVVPEHDDRQGADLGEQLARPPARSASDPGRGPRVAIHAARSFPKVSPCDNLPRDGGRQDASSATNLGEQAPDRRAAEARRRDGRRARGRARHDRSRRAPAPRRARRERPRRVAHAAGRGAGPAADGVGAHRSRAGSVPRPPRRSHRRPHHRGACRARRRRLAACDRRAHRDAARRVRRARCRSAARCARVPRRSRACAPTRATSPRSIDDPDGKGVLLVEHHCPICTAASACAGLCSSELELFREVHGPKRARRAHAAPRRRRPPLRLPHHPARRRHVVAEARSKLVGRGRRPRASASCSSSDSSAPSAVAGEVAVLVGVLAEVERERARRTRCTPRTAASRRR